MGIFPTLFPLFKKQSIQRVKRKQCTSEYRYSECVHVQQKTPQDKVGRYLIVPPSRTQHQTHHFQSIHFHCSHIQLRHGGKDQEQITEIICRRWQKNKKKTNNKQTVSMFRILHSRQNPITACASFLHHFRGLLGVLPWMRGNTL